MATKRPQRKDFYHWEAYCIALEKYCDALELILDKKIKEEHERIEKTEPYKGMRVSK